MIAFLGAFHGRTLGSLSLTASKAKYRAGLRAAAAGRLRPYAEPLRPVRRALTARGDVRLPAEHLFRYRSARRRSRRSSSSRSRARAATSCRPPAGWPAAGAVRPARHPARRRRGPERHGPHRPDVGGRARGHRARRRARAARASRAGLPLGALIARGRPHEVERRRARLDVRRQPGRRARPGSRRWRSSNPRACSPTRPSRASRCSPGCGSLHATYPGSSPMCVAPGS